MALTKSDVQQIKVAVQDIVGSALDKTVGPLTKKVGSLGDDIESLDAKVESLNIQVQSLDSKVESLDSKVESLVEFADFAKPALESLLIESQANFLHNLPERVKKLESIHPSNSHATLSFNAS